MINICVIGGNGFIRTNRLRGFNNNYCINQIYYADFNSRNPKDYL